MGQHGGRQILQGRRGGVLAGIGAEAAQRQHGEAVGAQRQRRGQQQRQQPPAQLELGLAEPAPQGQGGEQHHPVTAEGGLIDPQAQHQQHHLGQQGLRPQRRARAGQAPAGAADGQQLGCSHQRRIKLKRQIGQPVGLGEQARCGQGRPERPAAAEGPGEQGGRQSQKHQGQQHTQRRHAGGGGSAVDQPVEAIGDRPAHRAPAEAAIGFAAEVVVVGLDPQDQPEQQKASHRQRGEEGGPMVEPPGAQLLGGEHNQGARPRPA